MSNPFWGPIKKNFFGGCSQSLTLKDFTTMSWNRDMLLHNSYASVHRHLHNISEILQIKLFSKKPDTFFIHNPPFIDEDLRRTNAASSEYCVRRRVIKLLIMALSSAQWMELRAGCREKLNLMILFFYFHQTNGRFLPWVASSGWLLRWCGLALATHTRNENE